MGYAGTPGMVWGWLIAMAFIQCVAMGMGMFLHQRSLAFTRYLPYLSGIMLQHANQRRIVLRVGSPCTTPIWPSCCLAYWLVQLDVPGDWGAQCRLRAGVNDTRSRIDSKPRLCATELPGVPPHHLDHDRSCMHLVDANAVDCHIQLVR